eukprot:Gb_01055 [translate_table: standard]
MDFPSFVLLLLLAIALIWLLFKRFFTDTSCPPSSSPHVNSEKALPRIQKYDVFINHRGVDVKDTLASHIYDLLDLRRVPAFLDREELETGDPFPDAITEAIASSTVHIAIFSPRYAESSWCLRELALMVKTAGATIIPVFFNVTPEEIRWANKGNFAKAFRKHYKRYPPHLVDEWKAALNKVSDLSGLPFSRFKGGLARKVVDEVMKRVSSTQTLSVAESPIGLEKHMNKLKEYIFQSRMAENSVICVGIIGMGGIGKSTLAKALYNYICSNFSTSAYIEDVKGEVEKNGLKHIQQILLRQLLRYDFEVFNSSQGERMLREKLTRADALIVYDNIEYNYLMDAIFFENVLNPGSTIIVTTRDQSIFRRWNSYLKYELSELNFLQSKELFCRHAFHSDRPSASFESLVNQFVKVCKGLPLALKVCGGELYNESYENWIIFLKRVSRKTLPELLRGTESVRGLSLVEGGTVLWDEDEFGNSCPWTTDSFANMKELQLLQLKDDCLKGDFGKLSQKLLFLRWRNFPYDHVPVDLHMKETRILDLVGGKLASLWNDQSQIPLKLRELNMNNCHFLNRVPESMAKLAGLQKVDFSKCFLLKTIPEDFCYLEALEVLNLSYCRMRERTDCGGQFWKHLNPQKSEFVELSKVGDDAKLAQSSTLSDGSSSWQFDATIMLSPINHVHFTASAIPYANAIIDPSYGEATSPTRICQELRFEAPPSSERCSAVIICFVSVFLIDKFDAQFLPPQATFDVSFDDDRMYNLDFGQLKIGELINLIIFKSSKSIKVSAWPRGSPARAYLKKEWMRRIKEGEEEMIQHICTSFFKQLILQHLLLDAREHAPSQLNLRNVHALNIANCRIRRHCLLYDTPIQVMEMELVYRRKQLIWKNLKVLEHLDLSIVDTNLPPIIKSMANLYKMEVIISSRGKVVYTDELQEYDKDALVNRHDELPIHVFSILKSRELLKNELRGMGKLKKERTS